MLDPVWVGLYAMALMFPLSVQDSLDALRYTSFSGLLCIFYFWASLAYHFFWSPHVAHDVVAARPVTPWFQGIPVMFSAYVCQFNIFKIDRELKPEAKAKIGQVIRVAIPGAATTAYVTGGLIGYCMFGAGVKNDLLEEFNQDVSMTIARLMLALCNMFKIPLMIIPMRTSIAEALQLPERMTKPIWGRICMCAAINALVYTVAYNLESLSKALGLLGCTAGVLIAFIMPGLLRLKYLQMTGGRCIPLTCVSTSNMAMGDIMMRSPTGVDTGSFISGAGEVSEPTPFQGLRARAAPYALIAVATMAGILSFLDILTHWREQ
jgi:amino acid permease